MDELLWEAWKKKLHEEAIAPSLFITKPKQVNKPIRTVSYIESNNLILHKKTVKSLDGTQNILYSEYIDQDGNEWLKAEDVDEYY